jgi:hypothetical protein
MSRQALVEVVERASTDAAFRSQLESDPTSALVGYELTGEERTALLHRDEAKLQALGMTARITKQAIDIPPPTMDPFIG